MDKEQLARLVGVSVISAEDGRKEAKRLVLAVKTASDATEASEAIAAVMRDKTALAKLGALGNEEPGEWEAALAEMRSVRGIATTVSTLKRLVAAVGKTPVRLAGEREEMAAPDGVPDGYLVPHGYHMDERGIGVVSQDSGDGDRYTRLTTSPLWVTGRAVDVDSGIHALELSWPAWHGKGLTSVVVDANTAADARSLVGLANQGAPVHSGNSRELVRFIDACASTNRDLLPVAMTARRMGWMRGGFLLGSRWLCPDDSETVVSWHGDEGATQLADGFVEAGTWDGWLEAVGGVSERPQAWLAIYTAVASILLHPLGAREGFMVDWCGETSQGKSTVQRLAASVSGDPAKIIRSWKGWTAGFEAYFSALHHLAPLLDDHKKAKSRELVVETIYMHSGGMGANRGKPGSAGQSVGMRAAETWLSVCGSSGEQRATGLSKDAGTRARVLTMWGSPLETEEEAIGLSVAVGEHHGHLMPRVLRWLMGVGRMEQVRALHQKAEEQYREQLSEFGAVSGRLAVAVAYLDTAKRVCEAVGLPKPPSGVEPMRAAVLAAIQGGQDSDQAAAALRTIYELAMSQSSRLWNRGSSSEPSQGWIGSWDDRIESHGKWTFIALRPTWVSDQLSHHGYDQDVVSLWDKRGWLDRTAGHLTRPTTMGRSRPRLLRIPREALEKAGAVDGLASEVPDGPGL